jgi:hypothetical protein
MRKMVKREQDRRERRWEEEDEDGEKIRRE